MKSYLYLIGVMLIFVGLLINLVFNFLSRNDETRDTLIFACGYTYGQKALAHGLNLSTTPDFHMSFCDEYRQTAIQNHFDVIDLVKEGKEFTGVLSHNKE